MLAATSVCLVQKEMHHSLKSSSWTSEGRCEDANGTLTSHTAIADLVDATGGGKTERSGVRDEVLSIIFEYLTD